ncbi:hypothetical protein PCK1_002119 [Pneumocystis canis]|nr:hypothetical protein PCK1_002119 [Pneumocystis canis]
MTKEDYIDFVEKLPYEISFCIFSYLSHEEVMKCMLVCKRWYSLTTHPLLWKRLYIQQGWTINHKCLCRYEEWVKQETRHLYDWIIQQPKKVIFEQTFSSDIPFRATHVTILNNTEILLNWRFLYHQRYQLLKNWEKGLYVSYTVPRTQTTEQNEIHQDGIYCIQSDRNWIVSGSKDTTIRVWDLQKGVCSKVLRGHHASVLTLQFDTDMNLIVSGSRHRAAVNAVQLKEDQIVSAGGDRTIRIWNIYTGVCLRTIMGHQRGIACLQFDGRHILSGSSDCLVRLFDANSGKVLRTFKGHLDLVRTVRHDSHKIVSGSYDETICIWDLFSGKMIHKIKNKDTGRIHRIAFDDIRIISCGQKKHMIIKLIEKMQDILEAVAIHGRAIPDSEHASFSLYAKMISSPGKRIPLLYLSQDITYLPTSTRIYVLNNDGTASEETAMTLALGIPVFEPYETISSESNSLHLSEECVISQQNCGQKYEHFPPLSSPIVLHGSPTFYGRAGLSSLPTQEIIDDIDKINTSRSRSNSLFSVRSAALPKKPSMNSQKIRSNTDSPLKSKRVSRNSSSVVKSRHAGEEFLRNFCLLSSEKKENKRKISEWKKWTTDVDRLSESRFRVQKIDTSTPDSHFENNSTEKSVTDAFNYDSVLSSTDCCESIAPLDSNELTTCFNKYISQIATVELEDMILYVCFSTDQIREVLVGIEFISVIHEATDLGADGRCYYLNLQCLPICRNPADIRFDLEKVNNKNIHLSDTQIVRENLEEGINKSIIDVIDLTHESLEKRSWQCFWQVHLDAFDYEYSGVLNVQTKVDIRPMRDAVVVGFSSNVTFLEQDYDFSKNILSMGLIQKFHIYGPSELQFVAVKSMGILHWKCDRTLIKDTQSDSEAISLEQSDIYDYIVRVTRKKEYGLSDLLIESEVVIPDNLSTLVLTSHLHIPYFKIDSETIQFMKTSLPLLSYLIHPETRNDWKLISFNKDNSIEDGSHVLEYQCVSDESAPLDIHIEKLSPLKFFKETLYLNAENYVDNVDIEIFALSHSQWCLLYKVLITDVCICDNILLHLKHDSNPSFITLNGRKMSSGVYSRFDSDIYVLAEDWLYKDSFLKFEIGWVKDISSDTIDKVNLPILSDNGIKNMTITVDPDFGRIMEFNYNGDIHKKFKVYKIRKRNIPFSIISSVSILKMNPKKNIDRRKSYFAFWRRWISGIFLAIFVFFLIPFINLKYSSDKYQLQKSKPLNIFQRFKSVPLDPNVIIMNINELNQRLNNYELYIKNLENTIAENSDCCRNFATNLSNEVTQRYKNSLWFAEKERFKKIFGWYS